VAEQTPPVPDPFSIWREWVSQSERQWNAFLNQVMGTEQYNQSMSRFMDTYLDMQKNLGDVMGRYLSALNVASRADVLALGDRLAVIENLLRSMNVNAPESRGLAVTSTAPPVPRPPRTKKPTKV
jgi:hypothetical protein